MAAMNQLINANMKKALDSFTKEKETLEQRVIQEKTAQENLKSEKDLLQQELKAKREEFEAKIKLENEVRLSTYVIPNTSYLTDSYIVFTLKMEWVTKI